MTILFLQSRPRCPASASSAATRILIEFGDGSTFPFAAHLAAYAGITPVTRKSASSIRGEHPARSGKRNSNAPCSCPPSPPSTTPPVAPTTARNGTRRINTTRL
jgi:hypothetical protein